ncbi:MAG: DMT family transporter [Eubacterium sp.]
MTGSKKREIWAKVMLFASTIFWGSSFFIIKDTLDEIPVYFLLTLRFLLSAVIMSVVFYKKWKLINKDYIISGAITGVFLALAYIFQTIGLKYTTPGTNAFLTTVYCIIVPFMAWAVTKKAPDKRNVICAFIAIFGIGLVCLDKALGFSFMGEGMTILCGVFFAAQIVAIDVWGKRLDIILYTIIQFFASFIICLVFSLIFEAPPEAVSTKAVFSIGYLAVFATVISFIFMNVGIKNTNASESSLILCLESVFGVAFSMIFYHERPSLQAIIGFAVIFTALIINEVRPSVKKL